MKVKNHWSLQTHQRDDVVGDDASKQSLHCVFLWEKTNKTHQSIQQLFMLLNTWNKLSFFYSFCFIFVSSTCFFFLLKLNRKHVVGSFYSYKVLYSERLLQSLTNCKIKLELLLIRLEWSAVCLPAPGTSPRSWWWGRWRTRSCPSARRCSEAVCPSCRFYRRVEGCRLSSRSPEHDDKKEDDKSAFRRFNRCLADSDSDRPSQTTKYKNFKTLKLIKTRETLFYMLLNGRM